MSDNVDNYVNSLIDGSAESEQFEGRYGQKIEKVLLKSGFKFKTTHSKCSVATYESKLYKVINNQVFNVFIIESMFMGSFTDVKVFKN